jgi:hypothetical protein
MEGLESILVLLIVVVIGVLIAGYVGGLLSPSSSST